MFPGLCGEMAATPYRVFLGTLPTLGVEQRFLRQFQAVFPWYTSRKRVKEQANEFVEIDLASCDPELILRYTHVYYVRRQLYDELIDKQLTLIETGKTSGVADGALHACLAECNTRILPRLEYEKVLLSRAKRACNVPHRRELNPTAPLEPYDIPCMMRIVEEDACGVEDAEMKARAFLPRALIDRKAAKLVEHLIGKSDFTLDKKDQKTLSRLVPGDYTKVGCVEKVRPVDVATVFRFVGERGAKLPAGEYFKRALWGHAFRKYATHPAYLSSISSYWAKECGLDKESALSTMPMDLAKAVTLQQNLFPAHKYRAQYLYCSTDIARQQWKSDSVIPLLRLFPTLGSQCAEDLAASVIVDSEWSKLKLTEDDNPTQEGVVREVRRIVEEAGSLYDSNIDGILNRVEEGVKMCCPQLTEDEIADMSTTASAEKTE